MALLHMVIHDTGSSILRTLSSSTFRGRGAHLHLKSLGPRAAHCTFTLHGLQLSYVAGCSLQENPEPGGHERAEMQPTFLSPSHVA